MNWKTLCTLVLSTTFAFGDGLPFRKEDYQKKQTLNALVTAYCPCKDCCGSHANGKTSRGVDANQSGLAADPKRFPYGTWVNIPGVGFRKVDDTGGAMKGRDQFDYRIKTEKGSTWKVTHQKALEWGRQWLHVKVYKPKKQPKKTVPQIHTVQPEENLYVISKQYSGISWQQLAKINNIPKPYIIHPGKALSLK